MEDALTLGANHLKDHLQRYVGHLMKNSARRIGFGLNVLGRHFESKTSDGVHFSSARILIDTHFL